MAAFGFSIGKLRRHANDRPGSKLAFRYGFDIPNTPPELMSESLGNLLAEFCKGDTTISQYKYSCIQEKRPSNWVAGLGMDSGTGLSLRW